MNTPTILEAMDSPELFRDWFSRGGWTAWKAFLTALFGLNMDDDAQAIYQRHTSRENAPQAAFNEAWLIIGRRGGKSRIMALVATYLACFRDYRPHLAPGEIATIPLIAQDRKQARTLARYVSAFLQVPMLARLVIRESGEAFELSNRVCIEIHTASFRSVRGYTIAAALLDEVAFWYSDGSAQPDYEIIAALRPAMATIPGALLLGASSPYAKRGELWHAYRRYHGQDDADVLTWQAETRAMNPTVSEAVIQQATERDPERAKSEYLAQFRSDLETFLLREVVDAAVRTSPLELPFNKQHRYFAFVDPAGGGQDEYSIGIAHREGDDIIIDLVRARRGVPAEITAGYAALLKEYGIRNVTGDRYAGSWPGDEFKKHDIEYTPAGKSKSELYVDALASFNSGRVELPPDDRLINQLIGLERRTARGGRDSIDHAPGCHDDRANVIAGLVSTRAASTYDLERLINGLRASDEKHTQRRPVIEALRAAGIPFD